MPSHIEMASHYYFPQTSHFTFYVRNYSSVFQELIEPVSQLVSEQNQQLPKHHNQKLDYEQFVTTLLYFFTAYPGSLKLFITTRLNRGLLPPSLGFKPVPYSTFQEGFSRFPPRLFQAIFQHLVEKLPLKAVPELATLGVLCCADGSIFPMISSMTWAAYTSQQQALKLHCIFELNRMVPIDFQIGTGHSSERDALLRMAQAGVTYIADRGYVSFKLCFQLSKKQAFFIFRTKTNLIVETVETLDMTLPESVRSLFTSISDSLIRYTNDPNDQIYRLVCFTVNREVYAIATNRLDLTTFQVVMLYAYRWQIELLFRYLKRTMTGIHLVHQDIQGVTIQFYALLIVALLQLRFKQQILDSASKNGHPIPTQKPVKNPRTKPPLRLDKAGFLQSLGESVKTYWKIGIHWLTSLRDLLGRPFDDQAISVLLGAT
jgi:Transposase DDE domain